VEEKFQIVKSQTGRITIPEAEAVLGMYFPVLDHGFVALVDYMGGDEAVEQAARVSHGRSSRPVAERRGLLRYLHRHLHTSPSEMVELKFHCSMPIFVARQWIRHRTACLAGNVPLSFDLPGRLSEGKRKHYFLTVRQVFDRWQATQNTSRPERQKNPFHRREIVQQMHLRSVNEQTGEVYATSITNIVMSGVKEVLSVHFTDGSWLRATSDHKCLTSMGWLTLREGLDRGARFAGVGKREPPERVVEPLTEDELDKEEWRQIPGFPSCYEVSNLGRVRNWTNTRGTRLDEPSMKKGTLVDGYPSVSLSWNCRSRLFRVHKLVLMAFEGVAGDDEEARHLDGCRANPRLINLVWGTSQENADDRMVQGGDQRLVQRWVDVDSWGVDGEEEVFDISVAGPHHNFVAGGVVVHNSVNEMSGRYSILPMLFYTPPEDQLRSQSTTNRQGRSDEGYFDLVTRQTAYEKWRDGREEAVASYEWLCEHDFARELARIDLPLSTYTQWYWKIDMHNLLHFLTLRVDAHAQWEIQQYGKIMAGMLERVAPLSYEAWIDYEVCGARLSRMEIEILRSLVMAIRIRSGEVLVPRPYVEMDKDSVTNSYGLASREVDELWSLFSGSRKVPDFKLDLSLAKPASFFEEQAAAAAPGKR
jgi:thymidylate synthase ThyX